MTAHPNTAICSNGISGSTFTLELVETTAYSANPETPHWRLIIPCSELSRLPPFSISPSLFDLAPRSHNAGRPSLQGRHWPQLGINVHTMWSPFLKSVTLSPI